MAKLTWTVQFSVDESWVADGYNLTEERALDMLSSDLSFAYIGTELKAKIISRPDANKIAKLQGYKSGSYLNKAGELHLIGGN